MRYIISLFFTITICHIYSQSTYNITGYVLCNESPLHRAIIEISGDTGDNKKHTYSDSSGFFNIQTSKHIVKISIFYPGFYPYASKFIIKKDTQLIIHMFPDTSSIQEVTIESEKPLLSKKADAFNTEIYDACLMSASSSINLFEGIQNISGMRAQLNCNICNAGDIRINGMEGPYTNILIDGMPLIGGISSIYGTAGIPTSIIESIEINKYPGSVVIGSDNIAGTINIITKNPSKNQISAEYYVSDYLDNNLDFAITRKKKYWQSLSSLHTFWMNNIVDKNKDGFTDVTLQRRWALFHKSKFFLKDNNDLQYMFRYLYENRWGGQTNWKDVFKGSESIYGETVLIQRVENMIQHQWNLSPHKKIENQFFYNYHYQNSYYGTLHFYVFQHILYVQSFIRYSGDIHKNISGIAFKFLHYKDNTEVMKNSSSYTLWLVPSVYSESTLQWSKKLQTILGLRYDYHNIHKSIVTPRIAWMFAHVPTKTNIRWGLTTGFRPVQLFTEDHAALTGARKIIIQENLLPEKSYAAYINIQHSLINRSTFHLLADFNAWYIYFTNRITPDYSYPDKILYRNLHNAYSINKGISIQLQCEYHQFIQTILGVSLLDNFIYDNIQKQKQYLYLSEPWSMAWTCRVLPYKYFNIEYTGNIYGPMRLPLAGPLDPRPHHSPIFSIQNVQFKTSFKSLHISIGIKNLLNFTPDKNIPFLIARAHDPFDKNVIFDSDGNPVPTSENPYALTFDPTYTYSSLQRRRIFINLSLQF